MIKILFLTLLPLFICFTGFTQDIVGSWKGTLKVQSMQLRLVFHVKSMGDVYTSTMDSPDQGAKNIPTTSTTFENAVLKIKATQLGIDYEGKLGADGKITGNFKQMGQSFFLELSRSEGDEIRRPQEPVKPYPYYEEEVTFDNKIASVTLAGTLTLPKKDGVFPVVILISGSGPQNRDEALMGHKPFLVLADFLTKNGIAVLRFDDRGVGASTGDFTTATSLDFSGDVKAGIDFLKTKREVDRTKIGLIGHSEGGVIAPMVASNSKDVAFIVLLAGTGVSGEKILLDQQELIGRVSGVSDDVRSQNEKINRGAFEIAKKSGSTEQLKTELSTYLNQNNLPDHLVDLTIRQLTNPWMRFFISYDPAVALEKVKCPVLALNGEKDLQVSPKLNLDAIKRSLNKGGNEKVTTREFAGLNHLFQECATGSPSEYAAIEQTLSPVVMNEILEWLKIQLR